MRVIAGDRKGSHLAAPRGDTTRPFTDRAKESLFNILGARLGLPGMLPAFRVLDLFAGSGSLGIEALSRGAEHCTFYERDHDAWQTLRANLAHTRLTDRATVVRGNAWTPRFADAVRRPPLHTVPATDPTPARLLETRAFEPRAPSGEQLLAPEREFVPPFGLVFVDPPYRDARDSRRVLALLEVLVGGLSADGLIALRFGPGEDPSTVLPAGLVELVSRSFRDMHIVILGRV